MCREGRHQPRRGVEDTWKNSDLRVLIPLKGEARLPHLSDEFGALDKVWGGWRQPGRIRRKGTGGHTVGLQNWPPGSMWSRREGGEGKEQEEVKCTAGLRVWDSCRDRGHRGGAVSAPPQASCHQALSPCSGKNRNRTPIFQSTCLQPLSFPVQMHLEQQSS